MDRLPANHPNHITVPAGETDPLSGENLGIPASDRSDEREALVVDPGDDDADFVDVPREHDRNGRTLVYYCDAVARDVACDRSEFLRLLAPEPRRRGFETAWAGNVKKLFQERDGLGTEHVFEVRGSERPEARGQRPEARGQRPEVRGQRAERLRPEVLDHQTALGERFSRAPRCHGSLLVRGST